MGIRLGLVSLGSFGSVFAPLLKSHPLMNRIAFCNRNPAFLQRFAQDPFYRDKFDPEDVCASLDEILKAELDALAIITHMLAASPCPSLENDYEHEHSSM